ncbi:unnamed protein product [Cyprideis torosa]|uniref:Uncharacterized protein n=1 Tax=Cyprideis torosa TaxID=163714 RepID=A0A7R8WGK4_9CRUS|nr:unnamed protein product [Cyprideis torosa]CAG0898278.1 unnamed protein product [Cyprideis torosa]
MEYRRFETEDHARGYAQWRPQPPVAVAEAIVQFTSEGKKIEVACDVACGSGQLTFVLAPFCQRIVGLDISPAQIHEAKIRLKNNPEKYTTLSFKVSSGYNLPFPDSSVDLVTVNQAIHWFDLNRFYSEVDRVLKPGGVLSISSHKRYTLEERGRTPDENKLLNDVVAQFREEHLQRYNPVQRVDFTDPSFPSPWKESETAVLEEPSFVRVHENIPVQTILNRIQTLSSFQELKETDGHEKAESILKDLIASMNLKYPDDGLKVIYPYRVLLRPSMEIKKFEEAAHTREYARWRPSPPKLLVDAIVQFTTLGRKIGSGADIVSTVPSACDVACGSGQLTFKLAPFCNQIVGVDISASQIEEAKKKMRTDSFTGGFKNLKFEVTSAYNLPFPDSCLSLVTVNQAAHWFDMDEFYVEVDRVLKPGGVLSISGHGRCRLEERGRTPRQNAFLDAAYSKFYEEHLVPYFPVKTIDYRNLCYASPWSGAETLDYIDDPSFVTVFDDIPIDSFFKYIRTISAFQEFKAVHGRDAAEALLMELARSMGLSEPEGLRVIYPYSLLLRQKPLYK